MISNLTFQSFKCCNDWKIKKCTPQKSCSFRRRNFSERTIVDEYLIKKMYIINYLVLLIINKIRVSKKELNDINQ